MAILDPLVLPADVVIAPVVELPDGLREQIEHDEGDYSVTRPRSRTLSSIVDAQTAGLLESFRAPATIVDAVIAFSAAEGLDPRATLDDAIAVLSDFVRDGVLVPADSDLAQPIALSLAPGDRVGTFEVAEAIHVIVDTEVHLAHAPDGSAAALKILRPGSEHLRATLAHEAAVLSHLDGRVTPQLLELAEHDGRPYLAISWCSGVDVYQAAAEARLLGGAEGRDALLALAERVLEAYAHVHAQDVMHGDVHPRNLLVDGHGAVRIIDFGLAARPSPIGTVAGGWRGGIDFFMEPEFAAARFAGQPSPAVTASGEQYSIGALLYLLLTGAHTHTFSLEQEEMLRQLVEQPPLSFERHGERGLGAVERTLARALAKDPRARYRSLATLLRAFRAAAARDRGGPVSARRELGSAHVLLGEVLERLAASGELLAGELAAPTASAMNGGAGFAYALLRIAGIRDDERLLALADLWSMRALATIGSDDAFWNEELEIVPETFGDRSFYHHAAGVHCVQALVAQARGDDWGQRIALDGLVAALTGPCEQIDVAFGRAGLLLGASLALETLPAGLDGNPLIAAGDALRDSLWAQLEQEPELAVATRLRSLGAAHGWAGYLFAILRWSEASGMTLPANLGERLDQLAALARPAGRGIRWPHEAGATAPDSALAASWCNGAAGHVHLWTLAHCLLSDDRYERLAQLAAWSAYTGQRAAPGDLCCGHAGRAYALLSLYRHNGDTAWVARARVLAEQAAQSVRLHTLRRDSLYKGEVGVALLAAELEAPEHACMPLFASEGWPARARRA